MPIEFANGAFLRQVWVDNLAKTGARLVRSAETLRIAVSRGSAISNVQQAPIVASSQHRCSRENRLLRPTGMPLTARTACAY
jgi:hypothetical protein